MDFSRLDVSGGGEEITSVLGRTEKDEFPTYQKGAFGVLCSAASDSKMSASKAPHHLSEVLHSVAYAVKEECARVVERPTLFVTRYEYANLYHTMTDWYNTYQAAQMLGLGTDVDVVFLDGHAKGSLDDVWGRLFHSAQFVSSFGPGKTCFRRAVFPSPGYRSALSVESMKVEAEKCRRPPQLVDFFAHVIRSFSLSQLYTSRNSEPQVHVAVHACRVLSCFMLVCVCLLHNVCCPSSFLRVPLCR